MSQFHRLFREATELAKIKRNAEAADKYLEAVLSTPSVWAKDRAIAFTAFLQFSEETNDLARILKRKFVYNESEPAYYRAKAANVVARVKAVVEADYQAAADYIQLALEIIESSPAEHGTRQLFPPPFASRNPITVKENLDEMKRGFGASLATLEGKPGAFRQVEDVAAELDIGFSTKMRAKVAVNEMFLADRAGAGGTHCDCCKKSAEELNTDELSKCGRCKMAFYCSTECQHKAWYGGHKQACRKRGQVEVGDDMVLNGLTNRQELNGRFVQVIGQGTTKGKWLVKLVDAEQPMSVSAEKLIRLRPKA